MSDASAKLKPETIADLTQYVKATHGLFGALHLKSVASSCTCDVCAAIRAAMAQQNQK